MTNKTFQQSRNKGLLRRTFSQTLVKKNEIKAPPQEGRNISAPFMAKKTFSIGKDWKWNSDEDTLEVFEFLEVLGVGY